MIGTAAFWLSVAMVAYWAYWDFHRPRPPPVIRYAVTLRRYVLAAALYMLVAVGVFLMVLLAMLRLVRVPHDVVPSLFGGYPALGVPLAAALLVTVLLPELPGTRDVLNEVRAMVQRLALYPEAWQRLAGHLASQPCLTDAGSAATLRRELARYGLDEDAMALTLSPGALRRLEEAQALHDRMEAALADPALHRFLPARAEELDHVRQEHRRLLRRAARAMILAEATRNALRDRAVDDEHAPDFSTLSEFVADESASVSARYRRLIAEAALSCFVNRKRRHAFVARFGYEAGPDLDLPFWAIITIIGVMPVTMVIFALPFALKFAGMQTPGGMAEMPFTLALLLSAVFASQQVVIVLWAVVPKVLTRYARPSLRLLPWASYLFAGIAAYLTSFGIRVLIGLGIDPRRMPQLGVHWLELAAVTGIFAVVATVGLAIAIDLRLRDRDYQFNRKRWLDGLALGLAMAMADMLVQAWLGWRGGAGPGIVVTALLGLIGFALGWLVPSTVAAYLNHREAEAAKDNAPPIIAGEDTVHLLKQRSAEAA